MPSSNITRPDKKMAPEFCQTPGEEGLFEVVEGTFDVGDRLTDPNPPPAFDPLPALLPLPARCASIGIATTRNTVAKPPKIRRMVSP
jgi:hypothetical protein